MTTTAWLIGSYPDFPSTSITVSGESVSIAAGDYYLQDGTAGRSFASAFATACNAHSTLSDINCSLTKSGKLRLWSAGGTTFTVTWGSGNGEIARDFAGFTGNLSGASSYVASKSAWWWSPLRPESSDVAPLGVSGEKVRDSATGMANDATLTVTESGTSYRQNEFWWRFVAIARVWTSAESGGEFFSFFDQVLAKGRQWKLYRNVDEDSGDESTAATLSTVLGPYKSKQTKRWAFENEIPNVQKLSPIRIPAVVVSEFS